jgi:uncharacterized membrane protein YfcA
VSGISKSKEPIFVKMYSILLFFILALISEIIGTVGGFGSSVFFVPVAEFFFDFKSVLILTAIFHDFSNTSKLLLFRRHIDYKLLLLYGIPSTVFVIIGAYLSNYVQSRYNELILGIFLILFSTFVFLNPKFKLSISKISSIVGGSTAGFLAGLIGTGGAIRGMSLAAFNLEKNIFIATSAAIDFFVDVSRTIVYIRSGYYQPTHLLYLPFLLIVAFTGSWIGKKLLVKISQENFRKIVLGLLFLIGITMVVKVLTAA